MRILAAAGYRGLSQRLLFDAVCRLGRAESADGESGSIREISVGLNSSGNLDRIQIGLGGRGQMYATKLEVSGQGL